MTSTGQRRVLVTGSRDWTDRGLIAAVLNGVVENKELWGDPGSVVLVSGACPTGADAIAESLWKAMGRPVERHPAQWRRPDGTLDKGAGYARNAEMVASLQPERDVCVAFIKNKSPGSTHTANLAEDVGVVTILIEVP